MWPAAQENDRRTRTARGLVAVCFALIGAGVLGATLLVLGETRAIQGGTRAIVSEMVSSVHLLGRIAYLVEKRRGLIGDHIFSNDLDEMADLERQLAAVDGQIAAASRAYLPWINHPGEREAWKRTQVAIAALDAPVAHALDLSREGRNIEARRTMEGVAGRFAEIDDDLDAVTAINDRGAVVSLERLEDMRRRVQILEIAIGAASLAGTALVGVWAVRQVGQREAEMALHARLMDERNRELDAFAGRVAHDIRGPLSTMNLAVASMSGKRQERAMEVLNRGTKRMEQLVDDLLTLARSETELRERSDPARVAALIDDDFRSGIEKMGGKLHLAVAHAEVTCGEGLLRQALTNLVQNAIKYRRPEAPPVVDLSGVVSDGRYILRVSDNGAGMSQEDAAHAVEPFYRSPLMHEVPGTGLGLAIVSRVAQASGGALSIETRLGQGSTFVIQLPLSKGA